VGVDRSRQLLRAVVVLQAALSPCHRRHARDQTSGSRTQRAHAKAWDVREGIDDGTT
jgi:hypothetical protein